MIADQEMMESYKKYLQIRLIGMNVDTNFEIVNIGLNDVNCKDKIGRHYDLIRNDDTSGRLRLRQINATINIL